MRASVESARMSVEDVSATDYALKFGALSARASQLSAVVDELLANLAEIRFDCPRLLERVRQANESAKASAVWL